MSLGLLDDDNPWNDNQIPPNSTPDTGHAAAPTVGGDAFTSGDQAAFHGAPNGLVAGAKLVVDDVAQSELDTPNGHAPEPASWTSNGWPAVGQDAVNDSAQAAFNGDVAGAKRVSNDARPFELDVSNGHGQDWTSSSVTGWAPASSTPAANGAVSRRPSATASTSSTSSPPASRLHRSTSNASTKSRPAGWTTPAPAALQRSASRASTSSGRRPSGGAGAGDVNVKSTAAAPTPSAPRLHRSSSSASSRGAAALVQTLGDAWASATSLHRASSTSSSTTTSRPLFSTPTPTSTPPPQTQLRRRKGGPGQGHARAQTIDVTHDVHPLSQPPSPAASRPPSPPPRVTHTVSRADSLAGVALRYGVTVAALRRANGLWANDSIHLRTELVIPDGKGEPLPPPAPKTNHVRARTSIEHTRARTSTDREPRDVQGRRSFETRASTSTELPSAADVAASFSLTLPRLRLSLDRDAPSESDAEHELLPLSLSARRRKSRPQLSMTTTKQPSPIRGMVLPRPAGEE